MSDTNNNEEKVVLTKDDIKKVRDYYHYFEIPMPQGMDTALDAFEASPTLRNQQRIKMFLAQSVYDPANEPFQDPQCEPARERAKKIAYEMKFLEDLESELNEEQAAKAESSGSGSDTES